MRAVIIMLIVGWVFLLDPSPLEGFNINPDVVEFIEENKYNLDAEDFKSVEEIERYVNEYKTTK